MAIEIPTPLVEFILLGPLDDRRQLQDSPILGDVWIAFANKPDKRKDLLIAPYRGQHAGVVAAIIDKELHPDEDDAGDDEQITFLQSIIAAKLTFRELIRHVVPKTNWWKNRRSVEPAQTTQSQTPQTNMTAVRELLNYPDDLKEKLGKILKAATDWHQKTGKHWLQNVSAIDRFLALAALILWAGSAPEKKKRAKKTLSSDEQITEVLERATKELDEAVRLVIQLADEILNDEREKKAKPADETKKKDEPLVYQVSLNRVAVSAIAKSIPAVKADAATTLFKVDCSAISWAVIDSGIDGKHPALRGNNGESRIKQSFDFKNYRKIVSASNSRRGVRKKNIDALMADTNLERALTEEMRAQADEDLQRLAEDAEKRGPIHWELVAKYVEIKPDTDPYTNHGTHVAGIIGANKDEALKVAIAEARDRARRNVQPETPEDQIKKAEDEAEKRVKCTCDFADGMCPDITLYDFRVLGTEIEEAEFAIIAALQFIRYLNERDIFPTIHGANLSLSIPHDVRNFACGRTPICEECEQLVSSGVVVVAAAGNHGYKTFETKEGSYDSYAAFSITDPGNAERVITVGATHRFWPHTYGVSFFSSRGPTGDGRAKPDLVAPGEKIHAPVLDAKWGDLDGTSMAAPHVSGAAAMLMARYQELIEQPDRIKRILCESATDLGRERSFQGHGMLDVLRAFQSI